MSSTSQPTAPRAPVLALPGGCGRRTRWDSSSSETPSGFEAHALSGARVAAAVLAVMLAMALELIMRASHPPAAATTLLVALGSCRPTVRDTVALVVGVLLLAAVGEALRRLRLAQWAARPDVP